jgi:hypothetical protein
VGTDERPDAVVTSLTQLPEILERLGRAFDDG